MTSPSGYLEQFVDRETTNWVMVVLERAGVVELDRRRAVLARLVAGF